MGRPCDPRILCGDDQLGRLDGNDVEAPSSEEFNQEIRVVELVRERRRA